MNVAPDDVPGVTPRSGALGTPARALVQAVVALFFVWGGLTSLNDVLIPKLKGLFSLTYTEAMMTQFAFFTAYFVISLPAGKLISRVGFLRGIVIGLGTMAVGCLLFVPASEFGVFPAFLGALFVLAAGITILQVAANPLIANLGDAATSHSRLTLAQAFNSLGTTIFPPLGAMLILGSSAGARAEGGSPVTLHTAVIGNSYLVIALVLGLAATFFWTRRDQLVQQRQTEARLQGASAVLRRSRLAGGVISIFLYVGAEVTIGSVLVNWLSQPEVLGTSEQTAGKLLGLYWGGAMVGRFAGAWALRQFPPGPVLAAFALGATGLVAIAATTHGAAAGWALLAVGLMNSIMFPTIFSLALEGLGAATSIGSGLLCMAIVGGAVIPMLFGLVADRTTLAMGLSVPILCYLAISTYGWLSRRPATELKA